MNRKDGATIGVAAVACAACCAGPILGFLAAIGLGTAAGVLRFGAVGLLVAALAIPLLIRRRNRGSACAAPTLVPVDITRPGATASSVEPARPGTTASSIEAALPRASGGS